MKNENVVLEPTAKHMTENREFQGIPGIEVTPNGRLWATWYSGGVNEGPQNFVLLVTSSDNGATWSDPILAIDPPDNTRAFDPTLWLDPEGCLWLFWAQTDSPRDGVISNGCDGVWGMKTTNPDCDKPDWEEPVRIANGIMMNKPVALSNGEWAFPTALWKLSNLPMKDELKDEQLSNITISANKGKTFQRRGGADIAHRAFDEHMIVELADNRLWILVRTQYGIGQSFSTDGGKAWSDGESARLGGSNSRFFIRRLNSGKLLLINHADISADEAERLFINGKTWRKRSHLTAFLSDDDGATWYGGLCLDERTAVSYPDGCQAKDGTIRIIYDHERYKEGEILMASFTEEDVTAGKTVSEIACLRQLINKTGGVKTPESK